MMHRNQCGNPPSPADDQAPFGRDQLKGIPEAIGIIESYRQIRPQTRPILAAQTVKIGKTVVLPNAKKRIAVLLQAAIFQVQGAITIANTAD
jgi:hypothetical protein